MISFKIEQQYESIYFFLFLFSLGRYFNRKTTGDKNNARSYIQTIIPELTSLRLLYINYYEKSFEDFVTSCPLLRTKKDGNSRRVGVSQRDRLDALIVQQLLGKTNNWEQRCRINETT